MASTRELWILLRARDEASRVVSSFSKNVRAAALATQAAQKSAEAAAIRQQAQMLKSNGVAAQQIRVINDQVIGLEKQARAQTAAAAKAREYRAEQMKSIDATVRSNNVHAAGLERQARALTLAAAMGDEHRASLIRVTGATDEQIAAIDNQIATLRKRAATLSAEAAVSRSASASLVAQLQREQTGLDGSIRSYERRAAVLRAQAAQLRNQAQATRVNLDTQIRALTDQAAALDRQANAFRQAANSAREHDNRMRALIGTMGKVSEGATVAAFALGAIGVGGLIGLKNAIDTTIEYDRQVRATATQVDGFGANLKELGDIGKRVANEIGVGFETIQPALFDIFSSMEVNTKDAEKLLRSFSKAAVAGQVEIQDVSRATIGLLNAFKRPASDVTKILDIQFQLVQEGIGTYEEWNQRIGLVTPSAVRAGQSIEMMMGALATATRMGMSAARSGTSVARAMDAMSHPAAVKNMEQLGIKVKDASGKFRPMNKILRDFRDVLNKMPLKDRVEAILNVFKGAGGTIEARRFLQNVLLGKGNLELFDQVLKETENSAGSMEKAYSTMADSTAVKSETLRNKWMMLKTAIGDALLPSFNSLLDTLARVLDWFNKLPDSTKESITQFILWGSVISIVVAGIFGLIAVIAVAVAAIGTIGIAAAVAIAAIALIPIAIVALGIAFYNAYKSSETFREAVNAVGDNLKSLWSIVSSTAQSIKASFDQHILPPLQRLRDTINNEVLPNFRKFQEMVGNEVIPKIREAGRIIQDLADGAFKRIGDVITSVVIPAVTSMSDWWTKNGDTMRPLLGIIGQVVKWLLIIGAVIIGVVVAAFVGPLIAAIGIVVLAFQLIGMVVVSVINFFKGIPGAISAIGSAISGWASSVGSFFSGLWTTISGFFTQLFAWFAGLPSRILGFIQGLPAMLGNLFSSALNAASYAVGFGIGLIYKFFTELVPKAIGFVLSLPNRLAVIFTNAFLRARQLTLAGIAAVVSFFQSLPGKASSAVSSLWGKIVGHFNSAKTGAANSARSLVDGAINFFKTLPAKTSQALSSVKNAVFGAFKGAGSWLVGAGRDIINGVINGISGMIGGAVDMARNAARSMVKGFKDAIKSGSPSKVFMELGKFSMQGYGIGIVKEAKRAAKTVANTSAEILTQSMPDTASMRMSLAGAPAGGAAIPMGKVVNQNITINTQEIDPRRHAAELGWELEGRLR